MLSNESRLKLEIGTIGDMSVLLEIEKGGEAAVTKWFKWVVETIVSI